jgi:hypothetical protein
MKDGRGWRALQLEEVDSVPFSQDPDLAPLLDGPD